MAKNKRKKPAVLKIWREMNGNITTPKLTITDKHYVEFCLRLFVYERGFFHWLTNNIDGIYAKYKEKTKNIPS